MKKVFLFLILVIFLIDFVIAVGVTSKITENQNCIEKEDSCCLGEICAEAFPTCLENYEAIFKGCDINCIPKWECISKEEICIEKEDSCCLGDICVSANLICEEGTVPQITGCDADCEPIGKCENIEIIKEEKISEQLSKVIEGESLDKTFLVIIFTNIPITDAEKSIINLNSEKIIDVQEYRVVADTTVEQIKNLVDYEWIELIDLNVLGEATGKELTQAQLRNIIRERNRIKIQVEECPENCTCTGSVTKCEIAEGREMTVVAGKSGNIIIQVKGVNASTNVTLYKSEGKVYGVFKNNETREVRALPDAVKERIREKIHARLENETLELDEEGKYKFKARKRTRLFAIIPVRAKVIAEIDSETGEVIKLRKSWWGFLAKDVEDIIFGVGCGTVPPNSRDKCCQDRGFDLWNSETLRCEFSE